MQSQSDSQVLSTSFIAEDNGVLSWACGFKDENTLVGASALVDYVHARVVYDTIYCFALGVSKHVVCSLDRSWDLVVDLLEEGLGRRFLHYHRRHVLRDEVMHMLTPDFIDLFFAKLPVFMIR